jgi:hypothetical protein
MLYGRIENENEVLFFTYFLIFGGLDSFSGQKSTRIVDKVLALSLLLEWEDEQYDACSRLPI